jgi:hypothetical protein
MAFAYMIAYQYQRIRTGNHAFSWTAIRYSEFLMKNFSHFCFGIKSRFFGREFFTKKRANQVRNLVINPGEMFSSQ